ncbi:protein FAM173B [Clonorchis sinensis]|uniref:Protein FAM173B n=1 Tax=Clonorchis sinensis TaxID=79923 RepID=G7YCD1_CLOSI|nr:protein FAM173B [Clonorchis sinensis]
MNELTISDSNSGKRVHPYRWGVISGCGLTVACLTYTLSAFIAPAFRRVCLPFVPATPVQLDNIAKILLTQRKSACSSTLGPIVDLGSGDGRVMGELENKLRQELKPNTFVVAGRFPLPSLPCADSIESGPDSVYFYRF